MAIATDNESEYGLSFNESREVDRLAQLASKPSSNQNKYRYNLYAYIETLMNDTAEMARNENSN